MICLACRLMSLPCILAGSAWRANLAPNAYAALLAQEGAGRAVMIDPNIRPKFIEDADQYRNRLNRMIALSDIVKVSDEDLN